MEYNVTTDLKQTGCEAVDGICQYQNNDRCWAIENTVTNIRVP